MFNVKIFNNISDKGLSLFPTDKFSLSAPKESAHAILLRSHNLQPTDISDTTLVVGRAGVGVNNVPVEYCTERGIPVLNTPGANANAVKELVLAGMLLGSRNICQAWNYATQGPSESAQYEKDKSSFVGSELHGKTLGLIGLGNIGVKVANTAVHLGMHVLGYDPHITAQNAWEISSIVKRATSIRQVIAASDFISIHVPLNDQTLHLFNDELLGDVKPGAILLNFARAELIDEVALKKALEQGIIRALVTDFPSETLQGLPQVISLPHIGASTLEAQENCAVMIANQVMDFLENGNITYSVNFPEVSMPRISGQRLAITNRNVPNMLAQISTVISSAELNIIDMMNKSKKDLAYTLIDVNAEVTPEIINKLSAIDGIVNVRLLPKETS
jgi:D-3-phosphoglycerate dehydrogenase